MGRRVLFVLIDGLGDITSPDGMTPLQTAHTPAFDCLARRGLCGMVDPVEAGVACGSDTAHLSLLGYDPRVHYSGRGAFETLGAGLAMAPGDIAFKCVFAQLDPRSDIVQCRRADRDFVPEAQTLCKALDGLHVSIDGHTYTAAVRYATEHRCGVRIRGPQLSDAITGTDPLKDSLPLERSRPLDRSPEALRTAKVVNAFFERFRDILQKHPTNVDRVAMGKPPGNVVLFRGPAGRPCLPSFYEKHGLRACMIAPTCVIAGIGMALGMDVVAVPGATGDCRSDFAAKFSKATELLSSGAHDFAFVHIKAVDEASHSGLPLEKVALLERIDAALAESLPRIKEEQFVVVLTGDHTTPSFHHFDHTHHPVPFVACAFNETRDGVSVFDEISAAEGALGRFVGLAVMDLVKKLRG